MHNNNAFLFRTFPEKNQLFCNETRKTLLQKSFSIAQFSLCNFTRALDYATIEISVFLTFITCSQVSLLHSGVSNGKFYTMYEIWAFSYFFFCYEWKIHIENIFTNFAFQWRFINFSHFSLAHWALLVCLHINCKILLTPFYPNFINFSPFSSLISAATWETFLSFREGNRKWRTSFPSARIFCEERKCSPTQRKFVSWRRWIHWGKFHRVTKVLKPPSCAHCLSLCLFWLFSITPQVFLDLENVQTAPVIPGARKTSQHASTQSQLIHKMLVFFAFPEATALNLSINENWILSLPDEWRKRLTLWSLPLLRQHLKIILV